MHTTPQFFSSRALLACLALATAADAFADESSHPPRELDVESQQAILDCTFEVFALLRGANGQPAMRISGTAFCLGDGKLATAAHVFDQALGGRFESPVVRDRRGRVYAVDRVLRYSMADDFIVFTAEGLETPPARALETSGAVTDRLYVAWRRGDGDLAVTETQYRGRSSAQTFGRDGWIQFGPAPGHGASGGALLDAQGRVVGLINSRSSEASDAVAYAIPVAQLEAASTREGAVSMADPMRVLSLSSSRNQRLLGGIPLPSPYAKFARDLMKVREMYYTYMIPYSLSLEGADAPLSDEQRKQLCAKLGAGHCTAGGATLDVVNREDLTATQAAPGCSLEWAGVGATLVRCSSVSERSLAQAVTLARGQPQPGESACRASDELGNAAAEDVFADPSGAQWNIRAWPTLGCDWTIISMTRVDADGMLTLVRGAPSGYAAFATMQLKTLAALGSVTDHPGPPTRKHSAAIGGGGSTGLLAR